MPYSVAEAHSLFDQLPEFAATRQREIAGMLGPYIESTDRYARLVARLVSFLGHVPPKDEQDRVIRDLLADVFDFLYEARPLILGGNLSVAFPLARRAYESLSLLHLCAVDPKWATKWQAGKQIGNAEVRRALGAHPMGEPEAEMRELYKFFSEAAHPNRSLIPHRMLGEGNEFVLGLIGKPELFFVVDYCSKHLELWHWFAATVSYFYRASIGPVDGAYFQEYHECFEQAKPVKKWLVESLPHLHAEALEIEKAEGRTKNGGVHPIIKPAL
ncbi:hypothetical protein [Rhodoferax fermentans]|uniref:Uncharacterized protein n=1 Tax=Rhodoferax fermentans TaxID=28066 RepID=A0A1T1AV38_RHOFE|nr:hypothetical protein [Rhodoferax fermentans]MBK1685700.1 hypothetical protein [Rhodoferax fermentans]OOV07927.1 hypothetical protein RF819_15430 [Rhodoferax fermentans]